MYIYIYIYIYIYCIYIYIYTYNTYIYICTVRKSRHNNYKVMYSETVKKCFTFIFTLSFRHDKHVYKCIHLFKKSENLY